VGDEERGGDDGIHRDSANVPTHDEQFCRAEGLKARWVETVRRMQPISRPQS